jgi:DNA repair protein RecO (recombination protein O)
MPVEQSEAVVLKTAPCGEQDKLVTLFARDRGIVRGVAKGARKFSNRFGSSLEPLSIVRAFYYEKEGRELVTISNCDLLESFFETQRDLRAARTLAYFSELVEEASPTHARDDHLYRLLTTVLRCVAAGGDLEFLGAYFEAWYLDLNGCLPALGRCRGCGKALDGGWLGPRRDGAYCDACAPLKKDEVPPQTATFLDWARKNPPPQGCPRPLPEADLARIRKSLQAMIVYHLEREPRTLPHA